MSPNVMGSGCCRLLVVDGDSHGVDPTSTNPVAYVGHTTRDGEDRRILEENVRTSWISALALSLTLGLGAVTLSAPAFAGDAPAEAEEGPKYEWKDTKIPKYNEFFAGADEPIGQVMGARESIDSGKAEFYSAMELNDDTEMEAALTALADAGGDKLMLGFEGNKPTLSFADDAPDNVKAGATALNNTFTALGSSGDDLKGASESLAKMATEAPAMMAPKAVKTEVKAAGLKGKDFPGALKNTKANVSTLGKASGEAKSTVDSVTGFMDAVKSTFTEGELPAPEPEGEGEAAPE
jgi:hypothetical protein